MMLDKLEFLLAQIPNQTLRLGNVNIDKPGILAGEAPVCRLAMGALGSAYGALIVETVNNLPALLASVKNGTAESLQRRHQEQSAMIQDAITKVMCMRPGAKGALTIWSKLIWTTIAPILEDGYIPSNAGVGKPRMAPDEDEVRRIERDAVLQYTGFLMSQAASKTIESEDDLAALFSEWERSREIA